MKTLGHDHLTQACGKLKAAEAMLAIVRALNTEEIDLDHVYSLIDDLEKVATEIAMEPQ